MAELIISPSDEDAFSVRFGGEAAQIDVYTLSMALTGLVDAMRHINDLVSPDYELEVVVEGTSDGSFIARLRTRKTARTIFKRVIEPVVLGLLVNYLYQVLSYEKPTYHIEGNELVVETSQEVMRFPKAVFDHKDEVARSPDVARSVGKAIDAVEEDEAVKSLGLESSKRKQSFIEIPRADFSRALDRLRVASDTTMNLGLDSSQPRSVRKTIERVQLAIIKVVLKRSRRKWQFNLDGRDISASITDNSFFDRLQSREISISQGDSLDADLATTQYFDEDANVWRDASFEVVKVHRLIEGRSPSLFDFLDDTGHE